MAVIAKYSCAVCGVEKQEITVRTRRRHQDVVAYTHYVASVAGRDHNIRSPGCPSKQCDLYLPVGGSKQEPQIGMPVEGDPREVAERFKAAARAMNIPVEDGDHSLRLNPNLPRRD